MIQKIKNTQANNQKENYCDVNLKYVLDKEKNDLHQQEVTTKRQPCQNLSQAYGGSKYICPICICTTYNF